MPLSHAAAASRLDLYPLFCHLFLMQLPLNMRTWPLLFTFLTALLVFFSAKFTWPDGDDGRYAVWAMSIAQGEGITNIHLPEATPEVIVPPGLSIALAPVVMLFGEDNLKAMMVFSAFVLVLLAFIYAHWVKRERNQTVSWAIGTCIIGMWGVFTISSSWRVHTEILYMLLSISALVLWPNKEERNWKILIPGLLAGAAFMTRTVGLALLPAGILALLLRKQFLKAALFAGAFLAVNLPLVLRAMDLAGTPVGYTQSSGIEGIIGQLKTMAVFIPHYLFYGLPDLMFYRLIGPDGLLGLAGLNFLAGPLGILIGLLIAIGFFKSLMRLDAPEFYWGAYFLIIGSFNQPDYAARGEFLFQDRYVIPIIPLAAIYLARALSIPRSYRLKKAAMTCLLLIAGYVAVTAAGAGISRFRYESTHRGQHPMDPARYADYPTENDRAWGRYFECAKWLGSNAPPDAVVFCRKPYEVFLYSGRKTQRYLDVGTAAELRDEISRRGKAGGAYIIEDAFTADTAFGKERMTVIVPLLKAKSDAFELVYTTTDPVSRVWKKN